MCSCAAMCVLLTCSGAFDCVRHRGLGTQTCTRLRTRMMPTSSEDGAHASKVYQHQQHAAPPARTRRSEMHEGTHSSRTAHAIEPGPKMQTRPDLDRVCILGPEHRQRPSAAQRVPSIAIVKLDQKVHTL